MMKPFEISDFLLHGQYHLPLHDTAVTGKQGL